MRSLPMGLSIPHKRSERGYRLSVLTIPEQQIEVWVAINSAIGRIT